MEGGEQDTVHGYVNRVCAVSNLFILPHLWVSVEMQDHEEECPDAPLLYCKTGPLLEVVWPPTERRTHYHPQHHVPFPSIQNVYKEWYLFFI